MTNRERDRIQQHLFHLEDMAARDRYRVNGGEPVDKLPGTAHERVQAFDYAIGLVRAQLTEPTQRRSTKSAAAA